MALDPQGSGPAPASPAPASPAPASPPPAPTSPPAAAPSLTVTQGKPGAVQNARTDSPPPVSPDPVQAITQAPEPAAVEAPKDAPAEQPKPEEFKPHTETETLLEGMGKEKDEAKPEEPKADEAVEGDAPKPEPIKLEPYKLPENVKLDQKRVDTFNELLTKDGVDPHARGQSLIDMHVSEMTKYAEHLREDQHRVFADTRARWRKKFADDPDMGGAASETSKAAIAEMRDMFVSAYEPGSKHYEQDWKEFNDMLRTTGAGDNPAFLRIMHNVSRRFKEPSPVQGHMPPADIGRKGGRKGGRLSTLYDSEASRRRRGE